MARKYVNPAASATPVTDDLLEQARARAEVASSRLRDAEHADLSAPGWESEYEAASAAVRATSRRVEALEQLRAAQVERGGQRAAAVKAAAKDLAGMAASLAASRDQVAAAAAEHLRTLAALSSAAAEHNARLAEARAKLAATGLRVHDDLVDDGQEHAEGVLDGPGLRAGGVDWLPVAAGGVTAHALRQVFGGEGPMHPLSQVGRYTWRAHEVEVRADGLKVPALADAGAVAPEPPVRTAARGAPLSDVLPPRDVPAGADVSGYRRAPRAERKAAR
jgi:hypothetical protein